jgi:L,D-transpeptidase catalytic domain
VLITTAAFAAGAGLAARDGSPELSLRAAFPALPAAPAPAFRIPTPTLLDDPHLASSWSAVVRPAIARAAPTVEAAEVARLTTATPEGTSNIVAVLGRAEDAAGRLWARVRLPILPNGSTGWVPRQSLSGYHSVSTRLVVDLDRLEATLWSGDRLLFRAPVGVGQSSWPTPRGQFYIRDRVRSLGSPFYGPVAFGTSARSSVLTDWPAGGFIGIHGTNEPGLIPGRISHGCIRMRNADILRLARLMPVGTPLTIA